MSVETSNKTASKLFVVRNSKCRGCVIQALTYLINNGRTIETIVQDIDEKRLNFLIEKKILRHEDVYPSGS